MLAPAHTLGSLCLGRASAALGAVSHAQPHQKGVTETWVSVERGASKTVPPASTREETSSLRSEQKSGRTDTHDRCCAKPAVRLRDHSSELPHHVISPRLIQK